MQTNRREFIKQASAIGLGVGALSLTLTPTNLMAINNSKKVLPDVSAYTHLLNRTSFGVNQESMKIIKRLGYRKYIEQQLNPNRIDDSELEAYIDEYLPTVNQPVAQTRLQVKTREIPRLRVADELAMATYLRAIYSKKQLLQVMVEFWNNHFSVYHLDGPVVFLKTQEDKEVMRPLALSSFSQLLHASAKSPAMIYYLDGYASTKEAPNENYARELMELHTLSVDGPYSHHDINEVARCFTGWKINQRTGGFRFSPRDHDNDEKSVLGHTISRGGGVTDGEQVLDILAAQPSTAIFMAKKLCRHFIADEPSDAIVESTAEVFTRSNGDIKDILRHILLSDEFINSQDQKLKRPFHYMASVVRSLNIKIKGRGSVRATRQMFDALGQRPFFWQAPDGYPDVADYWQSTTGMLFRWNFSNASCFGDFPGYQYDLSQLISLPHTPENIVKQITEKIIFRQMTTEDKNELMDYLTTEMVDARVPLIKIQGALAIVVGSPYFQLT